MKRKVEETPVETIVPKKRPEKLVKNGKAKKQKLPNKKAKEVDHEIQEDSHELEADDVVSSPNKKKSEVKKFPKKNNSKGSFKQHKPGLKPKSLDNPPEKLDKKEARKRQKMLREKRKEKERGYALPDEAKKMFEEIRCNKCPPERRTELSQKLYDTLSGKLSSVVRSHDLARIIQWLIKVGSPDIKQKVVDELIASAVSLSKTKYSNHIVLRILKDCDKPSKHKLLNSFISNIASMLRNRFAAAVVEEYYSKCAKSEEKAFMRQELYSDLFRGGKNPSLKSLSDVLSQNPTLTSAILNSTKTMLTKLINKNSSLRTSIVTDVLYDYFQHCEEQDKLDMLEILKNHFPLLLKNKSGSRVVMYLLWQSTAKVKKSIVKELKTQVLNIAKSSGSLFLLSLFDSVDDTVLIKKAILPTILENAEDLVINAFGRRVLLYLVVHRDPAYFHPNELEELKKADESSNVKKDIALKKKELQEPTINSLLAKISENTEFWFSEPNIAVVSLAVLKKGSGDSLLETYSAMAEFLARSIDSGNSKVIEDPGIHMIFKNLIKHDPLSAEENNFSVCFSQHLNVQLIEKLVATNRGCFLLVHLIETNNKSVASQIKKLIKNGKLIKTLENQTFKGADLLKDHVLKKK